MLVEVWTSAQHHTAGAHRRGSNNHKLWWSSLSLSWASITIVFLQASHCVSCFSHDSFCTPWILSEIWKGSIWKGPLLKQLSTLITYFTAHTSSHIMKTDIQVTTLLLPYIVIMLQIIIIIFFFNLKSNLPKSNENTKWSNENTKWWKVDVCQFVLLSHLRMYYTKWWHKKSKLW